MLLRSSSTPVLGSLLVPSFSHTEPLAEKNEAPGEVLGKCVSLRRTSSNSGSLTTCQGNPQSLLIAGDPSLGEELGWGLVDAEETMVWSMNVRKVQSESDLCNLGANSTSARVAACTLVCNDKTINHNSGDDGKEASSSNIRKARPMPLNRRRSLSSFQSVCFGTSGLDIHDFIPEEADSASVTGEEGESRFSVIYKLGLPVEESNFQSAWSDAGLELVNQGLTHDLSIIERVTPTRVLLANAPASSRRLQEPARDNLIPSLHAEGEIFSHPRNTSNMQEGSQASESKLLKPDGCVIASGSGSGGARVRPPAITGGGGGGGGGGSDVTDLHYQKMLKENPAHPLLLRNYAQYLAEVKGDYRKAEEFFQRAILANPSDGELLGQYAKIIWDVHQERERAASYFERAVQAAPDDSYVMAAYASFLWNSEEEEEEEEEEPMAEGSAASSFPGLPSLVSAGIA